MTRYVECFVDASGLVHRIRRSGRRLDGWRETLCEIVVPSLATDELDESDTT